jgi:hypothetical protein
MGPNRPKIDGVVELARKLIASGHYVISSHAKLRQAERSLNIFDIKNVIENGHHEVKKDQYILAYNDWNYAIKGKTIDGDYARICVAFEMQESMVIVTVIRLDK